MELPDVRRRVRQGRRLALARACDARPGLRVHDALAGWGTDGLVLAVLGCRVHLSERNAEVYRILDSRLHAESRRLPLARPDFINWEHEDARDRWRAGGVFDVVYLDPMFGDHPKTALPAKQMQMLANLAGEMAAAEIVELIEEARGVASSRVVVKRRARAAAIGRPDWQIRARSVRFDVYLPVPSRSSD
ncbi:MAG: class I SAM-dependent methyltransferase [Gammaproteobacteria bacterium]|nr:class I SAM-dependent methyltransferase [Gammaproteobacteria bacterium]MDE0190123.1 class I SAM-dependent methyltransferase [Gammaproteobacteria bacterium]